jgi:stage III sporulation protein AG
MQNQTNRVNQNKSKNIKIFAGLGLAAGVFLVLLSFISPGESNNKPQEMNLSRIDSETYVRNQEDKLKEILNRIEGVSDPFVMITLDSSSEQIFAVKENTKENSSRNGETVQKEISTDIIFYGDDRSPILIKEIQPKIKGVAVICKGISNAEIQMRIINLVSTVLNLPTNRVYVISAD